MSFIILCKCTEHYKYKATLNNVRIELRTELLGSYTAVGISTFK